MAFSKIATGLQHIGVPTNDLNKTIEFYVSLGFEVALRTANGDEQVAFLRLGDLTIETYQNFKAAEINGAVDHIAINVTDVDEARRIADSMNLEVIEEGQLPFWENGVKYFTILGPNREKLEFNQYL
ncbi:MAG: VOC family protein [Clostridia bacterium]|nr:VOC family protein [Clostridia bacterium]